LKVYGFLPKKKLPRLDSEAAFLVEEIKDPRKYGVIKHEAIERGLYQVKCIEEKLERPPSILTAVPIYAFTQRVFKELARMKPGKRGEIQLTDAIQSLVTRKKIEFQYVYHRFLFALEKISEAVTIIANII